MLGAIERLLGRVMRKQPRLLVQPHGEIDPGILAVAVCRDSRGFWYAGTWENGVQRTGGPFLTQRRARRWAVEEF